MSPLLAVVLVCAVGVAQPDCTRETAIDIMIAPARLPGECLQVGQFAAAASHAVPPDATLRVLCERRRS